MRIGRLVGYLVGGKNLATNSCLLKKSWCNNIYYAQSTNKIKLQSGKGEMEGTAAPTENKTIDQTGMNEEKIEAAEGNPTPVSKPRQRSPVHRSAKNQQEEVEVDPKYFSQLDIRVGTIVDCWKHPESENLYCQKISTCGEVRQIASGLQKHVQIDNMKGKVLVMVNLKARSIAGFVSNGMIVCASTTDHSSVQLIVPEGQEGERVYLEGFEELFTQGQIQPIVNPKKKILERCLQCFRTDAEGRVVWKGVPLRTKAGLLYSAITNGNVS